jgi:hypothetical protein
MGLREVNSWLRKNVPTGIGYGIRTGMLEVKYGTLKVKKCRWTGKDIKVVGFHNPWLNLPRYLQSRWYSFLSSLLNKLWKPVRFLISLESALAYGRFGWNTGEGDPDFLKNLLYFKLNRMMYEFQVHDHMSEEEQPFKTLMAAQVSMQHAIYSEIGEYSYSSLKSDEDFAKALDIIKDNHNTWWS